MSDQRSNDRPPMTHFENGIPILPRPTDEAKAKELAEKANEEAYKSSQLWLNRWMVIFTAALVLCTVVTAVIYNRQLATMKEQLDEMRGSSAQTERLLRLQQEQLVELRRQTSDTHDLAVAAGKQANAAGSIALNAASQSKSTAALADSSVSQVGIMRSQLEISQRPWVGVDLDRQPMISIEWEPGRIRWLPYYKNSGNSPALKVKFHSHLFQFVDRTPDYSEIQRRIEALDVGQQEDITILSGSEVPNHGSLPLIPPDPALAKAKIHDGTLFLILGGKIQYLDEFGGIHVSTYCFIYGRHENPLQEGWVGCPITVIAT